MIPKQRNKLPFYYYYYLYLNYFFFHFVENMYDKTRKTSSIYLMHTLFYF